MVNFGNSPFSKFPLMIAFQPADSQSAEDFTGEAIVDEEIQPRRKGRVYWRGSYWPARCNLDVTLKPEEFVEVVGIDNITLLVMPFAD